MMKQMTNIGANHWQSLRTEIRLHTALSLAEISSLVKKHTSVDRNYAIRRLQQERLIKRIQGRGRGLYIVIDHKSGTPFVKDPVEAIQTLYGGEALFCYGTALYLHGLSRYGRLTHYYIAREKPQTHKNVDRVVVRFVKTRLGTAVGVVRREYGNRKVMITDLERTLVDCIHRPKYAQGWENVLQALEKARGVHASKIVSYVKQYGTPSLASKVGVALEKFRRQWRVSNHDLESLGPYLPRTTARFERGLKGRFNKTWNIYVPEDLFDG